MGDGWIWRIQSSEEIENRYFDPSASLFTTSLLISIRDHETLEKSRIQAAKLNLLREEEEYQRKRCFDRRRISSMIILHFPPFLQICSESDFEFCLGVRGERRRGARCFKLRRTPFIDCMSFQS